jgi:voltage-gated potassium channel
MVSETLKSKIHDLYHGQTQRALHFRIGLIGFDLLIILFFIVSSMFDGNWIIFSIDYFIAIIMGLDFYARASIEVDRKKWIFQFDTVLDVIVIFSLLASMITDNLSFLRIIRTFRLLRSYRVLQDLRKQYPWFRTNQEVIQSVFNLFMFVFFITACVFVVEHNVNDQINNYLDALYFTVTTLTTTGFGDITMKDPLGRFLSIIIMVVGVSLFLRLVQTIFRPAKVRFPCPDCGLLNHDKDAVHCKHCGKVLNIPNDGF